MKTWILSLVTTLVFSANAQARLGDQVEVDSTPILQHRTYGGMPGPDGSHSRTLTLTDDGTVIVENFLFPGWGSPRKSPVQTGRVVLPQFEDADVVAHVIRLSAKIQGGAMEEPKGPGCMDAPNSSFEIVRAEQGIRFAETSQCRTVLLKDRAQAATAKKLHKYLNNLERRYYESQQKN